MVAAEATPDWLSLVIEGPSQVVGPHGRVSFEWTATLIVDEASNVGDEATSGDERDWPVTTRDRATGR